MPPAGNGTTILIGLAGYACANADTHVTSSKAKARNLMARYFGVISSTTALEVVRSSFVVPW